MCVHGFASSLFHLTDDMFCVCVFVNLVEGFREQTKTKFQIHQQYISHTLSQLKASDSSSQLCRNHRPPKFSRFIFICHFHFGLSPFQASNNVIIALVTKMIYVFSFSHSLSLFLFFIFFIMIIVCA